MPSALDLSFVVLFSMVVVFAETVIFFPRVRAAVAAGQPDARRDAYRHIVYGQWGLAALAVILWFRSGQPLTALGLVPPMDSRLTASLVIVGLVVALAAQQLRAIRRITTERRAALRPQFAAVEFMLPHSTREYRWFLAVSVTAGICEELLYRGFLTWVLQAYIGMPGAIAGNVLLFGLGHVYQGARGALKAGVAGFAMNLVVVATGWLLPAMILHALLDVSAGVLGFRVLGDAGPS